MAVIGFDITSRTPVAGGIPFGEHGPYEEISGTLRMAVDPTAAANRLITDLDLAPRATDGLVTFDADLVITAPVQPSPGGRLLVDVPNRGRAIASRLNSAQGYPAPSAEDVGNGFLMRQGFVVARCGWQYDAPLEPGRARLRGPVAHQAGKPVTGPVLCHFQVPAWTQAARLSDRDHMPYPAADLTERGAVLTVRGHWAAAASALPRSAWRFARNEDGRPVDDPWFVWLDGGFQPGLLYELVYTATNASVVGLGLLAIRDVASWLRFATAAAGNPYGGVLGHAIAFGESQTGRLLREFLYYGLNVDEQDRMVYDGMFITVTGARRGEFNMRFGQPSKTLCDGLGAVFPFHDSGMIDPVTMRRDGLMARLRIDQQAPKVFTVNASTEYWGGDRGSGGQSSLLHTDPAGTHDVDPPETARLYLLAGTQHVPLTWPAPSIDHVSIRCAQPLGSVDHRPLQRALLMALDAWVRTDTAPPPNRVPRLADGSAVRPPQVLAKLSSIPGFTGPEHLSELRRLEFDLTAPGVPAALPPVWGEAYQWYVSAVDGDGNETSGIRHPDIEVPLATYTGHNVRHAEAGAPGELVPMAGATYPFPATASDRRAANDPRPSIEERYTDRDSYLEQIRRSALTLVEQRLLLDEDIAGIVEHAAIKYDAFTQRHHS